MFSSVGSSIARAASREGLPWLAINESTSDSPASLSRTAGAGSAALVGDVADSAGGFALAVAERGTRGGHGPTAKELQLPP